MAYEAAFPSSLVSPQCPPTPGPTDFFGTPNWNTATDPCPLVCPLILPRFDPAQVPGVGCKKLLQAEIRFEGYLVGAYCIEDELLTWRRLRFPHGVSPGDMIVFVNTAGYQMHILESASHQIPLAANLIVSELAEQWVRDRIDTTP